jgi:hypothetical protein
MPRVDPNDLLAFGAVARERSFTRAAAQLGVSLSALSHTQDEGRRHGEHGRYGARNS